MERMAMEESNLPTLHLSWPINLHKRLKDQTMPISIFQQAGELRPKHYSCQLCLDWQQIDIGQGLVRGKISWLTS